MHIPTSVSRAERAELLRLCRGRRVIEAGSLLGGMTVALAAVAPHVVSIDKHAGYGPPTWRSFKSNLACYTKGNVTPIRGDAVEQLPQHCGELAFLDLTGTFEQTLRAIRAVPQGTITAVHDFNRQSCAGVEAAIRAAGRSIAYTVGTLAVLN